MRSLLEPGAGSGDEGGGGGGLSPLLPWQVGRWHDLASTFFSGSSLVGSALANDIIFFQPVLVPNDVGVDQLAAEVTTADAASATSLLLGLYSESAGRPGSLLAASAALDTTSVGWKTSTFAEVLLTSGWYFLASMGISTVSISHYTPSNVNMSRLWGGVSFNTNGTSLTPWMSHVWNGTLPAVADTGTPANYNSYGAKFPVVRLRVSSVT